MASKAGEVASLLPAHALDAQSQQALSKQRCETKLLYCWHSLRIARQTFFALVHRTGDEDCAALLVFTLPSPLNNGVWPGVCRQAFSLLLVSAQFTSRPCLFLWRPRVQLIVRDYYSSIPQLCRSHSWLRGLDALVTFSATVARFSPPVP